MNADAERKFVSRAGLKLEHALNEFDFDVSDLVCADFGCNVGGFTDCLLQRGAAHVTAIDTGYGVLDYKLRTDDRVTVMERTNALHADAPQPVDLVVIDLAWTPQRHAIPAALKWLKDDGRIITLVKPHYELAEDEKQDLLHNGVLDRTDAQRILDRVLQSMPDLGVEPIAHIQSPITGKKSSKNRPVKPGQVGTGNVEFLVLCRPFSAAV